MKNILNNTVFGYNKGWHGGECGVVDGEVCSHGKDTGIMPLRQKHTQTWQLYCLLLGILFVWGTIGISLHPGLRNLGKFLKCACLSWTSI